MIQIYIFSNISTHWTKDFFSDAKRIRSELEAWKERSRRNIDQAEDQIQALHESQRGAKHAEEKIMAKVRELKEKDALIEDQASEIGKLRVNLAETKVVKSTDSSKQTVTDF